ncbi:hypothetical protein HYALB_00004056 [Hymenoscyphus albidus]|uniref:C3H1-type domain-containing protein n=1 Tax=Hymenoscyphus albidus TaxID=595503 RepID=A0A9N9LY94_9HELO|nr:hypothetical protein HYALB_00004056 [Hymenoscyphus albidus]
MSPLDIDLLGSPISSSDSLPIRTPSLAKDTGNFDLSSVLTPNEVKSTVKKGVDFAMANNQDPRSGPYGGQPYINNYSSPPPGPPYAPNYAAPPFFPAQQYARPRGNSTFMGHQSGVPLSAVVPGNGHVSEIQLDHAYAYAIRRPDGHITRLLPADAMPALDGISQYQGPEGVIVLPQPRQPSPRRRLANGAPDQMVSQDVVNNLQFESMGLGMRDTQSHIDSIVAQSSAFSPPPQRREKIYCDKWIHEGVCAFTQMGCKYKHEMPTDKATQMSLGLNHGLPSWYRRAYSVGNAIGSPGPSERAGNLLGSPPTAGRINNPWRQLESAPNGNNGNGNGASSAYGAIGTPFSAFGMQGRRESMQTDRIKTVEEEDEESDQVSSYNGRGRANTKA